MLTLEDYRKICSCLHKKKIVTTTDPDLLKLINKYLTRGEFISKKDYEKQNKREKEALPSDGYYYHGFKKLENEKCNINEINISVYVQNKKSTLRYTDIENMNYEQLSSFITNFERLGAKIVNQRKNHLKLRWILDHSKNLSEFY